MAIFTDVTALMPTLCGRVTADAGVESAQLAIAEMTDAEVLAVLRESASVVAQADQVRLIAAGVAAARSTRNAGHSGLAQTEGYRSPISLVQHITGSTKNEAARQIRVGEALMQGVLGGSGRGAGGAGSGDLDSGEGLGGADGDSAGGSLCAPPTPWHAPLGRALGDGMISSAQFDAIKRGLGEPPVAASNLTALVATDHPATDESRDANDPDESDEATLDAVALDAAELDAVARAAVTEAIREAWSLAAEQLVLEAPLRTTEELVQAARMIRDQLDPEGAEARFMARFENRSFRTWRDADGQRHAKWVFDDEGDVFIETVHAAALRPRRGGPRFVDSEEREQAAALVEDQRTNDQLAYDLMMDVLRAGVLADVESVFGTRQAGVRLVQVVDAAGNRAPIAHSEDGLTALPAFIADQHACESGTVTVTVDACGNPLDLGREQRLFSPKQRIALAVRDGGCRWHGCDRPASYCEAHHIDAYADGGRTDIDRGILLCRYHHMTLHHGRWQIRRTGKEDFTLRNAEGKEVTLARRVGLKYAFGEIAPPTKRFRPTAA